MDSENVNILSPEEQALLDSTIEESFSENTNTPVEIVNNNIPENSNTLLLSETTSRFSSVAWFDSILSSEIVVAGLGGIGSNLCYLLSRLNPGYMIIYDNDQIEPANLSGQLYRDLDVGQFKADATYNIMRSFSRYYRVTAYDENFDSNSETRRVMMCGFDNMTARKVFFNRWYARVANTLFSERKNLLFIDGRLAAEEFQVFCIRGDCQYLIDKYYKEYLFSDEEAEETPCSYKQTSFCASMIASIMVNLFVNFHANKCDPLIERPLPFYTYYDATTMTFKTSDV